MSFLPKTENTTEFIFLFSFSKSLIFLRIYKKSNAIVRISPTTSVIGKLIFIRFAANPIAIGIDVDLYLITHTFQGCKLRSAANS